MNTRLYRNNISSDSIVLEVQPSAEEMQLFLCPKRMGFIEAIAPFSFGGEPSGCYIVLTISGSGCLQYMGAEYSLGQYDFALVTCQEMFHFYVDESDKLWRFLFVQFDGAAAQQLYKYILGDASPVGWLENNTSVISLMWQIINRYKSHIREPQAAFASSINLQEILNEIFRASVPNLYYNLKCPTYIKDTFCYIDLNYTENISLETLQKRYAISKYHLVRQFKRFTGITIKGYISNKRLSRAKYLLTHSEKSISEIAVEIGFYDAGHFISHFKSREKITPNAYREMTKCPK